VGVKHQPGGPASSDPLGDVTPQDALTEVGWLLGSTLDLDRVLDAVAGRCRALLHVRAAGIFRVRPETGHLVYERGVGFSADFIRTLRVRPGEGTTGRALSERTAVWSRDLLDDAAIALEPATRELVQREGYRGVLSVPLLSPGGANGVLAAYWWEPHVPSEREIGLMSALAGQAAVALDNARLYAAAQARGKRLATLARLTETLTATLSLEEVLDRVVQSAVELFDSATAGLWLPEEDGRSLALRSQAGRASALDIGLVERAVAARTPLVVADLRGDDRLRGRAPAGAEGAASYAAVPLVLADRAVGALGLALREERTFTEEDLSLLQSLGNHAAIAIGNARRFAEEQARKTHLAGLLEVSKTMGALVPADEAKLLDAVASEAARLLGLDNAGFRLVEGDELVVAGTAGHARETMLRDRIKLGESLSGQVAASGRTLLCDLNAASGILSEHLAADRRLGYTSFLGVPLRVRDRIIGVLTFRGRRPFGRADQELAETFAGQAAIAIDNARLYREAESQAEHMRAVAELGRALVSTFEVDRILEMVTAQARESLGMREVGLCLEGPETGRLRFVLGPAVADGVVWGHELSPGEGVAGLALAQGRPVWTADILADPAIQLRPETRARLAELGSRAVLAVPLVRGRPFGALVVHREVGHRFDDREVGHLSMFASQVAVAVQNARLYAETRRRLEETRALLEVEEILNSPLDPGRRLKEVAIRIAQVCRADRCTIERWDGDRVLPLMSQFADGHRDDRLWQRFSELQAYAPRDVPAYARIVDTRRPVAILDAAASDLIPPEWSLVFGQRSMLLVPLARHDAVIGVLILDRLEPGVPFETWQMELATAIAGQLALSIENTRLYTEAQERLRETTTLLAVGQALSHPGDPVEVMRQVARELGRTFKADMVGVYVIDERREALVPLAGYHVPKHLVESFLTSPFVLDRCPWLREALRKGQGAWSPDVGEELGLDPAKFEGVGRAAVLLAPTMVRGEASGALFLVWWGDGRQFDAAEARLLEGVAGQVGLAMEIADLVRQGQQKRQETETLLSVSRILASTLDLEALPRQLLRHVVRALGGDMGGIWLLDEGRDVLMPLVGYHVPKDVLATFRDLRISLIEPSLMAEAIGSRRPAISRGAGPDPRVPPALRALSEDATNLFVPIIVKDRIMGGLGVSWRGLGREVLDQELRLVEMVASQAGVALQNAQLFRDNQRRVEELSVLHQVSRVVTGQLDQRGLLEAVRECIARVLDVRFLVVLLLDDAGERVEVALRVRDGVRVDGDPRGYPRRQAGLTTVVLDIERPIRTADYAAECLRYGVEPTPASAGLPNWLGVPMAAGDRLLGILALRSPDRAFTSRDERLLSNIADLVALALRSAQLYEERARAYGELAAAHDQLVRTEKLRAMGEMASGVAHDFNNVLAAILGRAQLLRDKVDDPKLKRWIEVIERSAMDGARTVKRLQEFTRIRRDQPVVAVNLNQVLQEALEATEPSWRDGPRRRGVEIEATLQLAPSLPAIPGDPAELRDAMTNLVLNAVDAMPRGGRLVLATARTGDLVELTVTDTGTGIPEAIRQRIFDPFFTTKGPKGTGLGLSMAYGILGRHGARITVESEEGRGTTFRLVFRPAEGALPTDVPEASPPDAPTGLSCLVVDDEEVVGEVLGDMLTSAGHAAAVVRSGADAVARLGAGAVDVVFTDLAMPGMSGWEVARAAKARSSTLPVILVTGFGVEVAPEDLEHNGVDAVLAKPLRLDDIQRVLASLRPAPGEGRGVSPGGVPA